jgi:hypothetical protein
LFNKNDITEIDVDFIKNEDREDKGKAENSRVGV